jgi:hypothetical protein
VGGLNDYQAYEDLRSTYVSANQYLSLYGLAPRIFGQIWGEQHLRDLDPRFQQARKAVDPEYEGQYDLWIEGVRVEVKAARALVAPTCLPPDGQAKHRKAVDNCRGNGVYFSQLVGRKISTS